LLSRFGMKLEIISEKIGPASATKMCRSIMIKGPRSPDDGVCPGRGSLRGR
jgi:hypothetical protein